MEIKHKVCFLILLALFGTQSVVLSSEHYKDDKEKKDKKDKKKDKKKKNLGTVQPTQILDQSEVNKYLTTSIVKQLVSIEKTLEEHNINISQIKKQQNNNDEELSIPDEKLKGIQASIEQLRNDFKDRLPGPDATVKKFIKNIENKNTQEKNNINNLTRSVTTGSLSFLVGGPAAAGIYTGIKTIEKLFQSDPQLINFKKYYKNNLRKYVSGILNGSPTDVTDPEINAFLAKEGTTLNKDNFQGNNLTTLKKHIFKNRASSKFTEKFFDFIEITAVVAALVGVSHLAKKYVFSPKLNNHIESVRVTIWRKPIEWLVKLYNSQITPQYAAARRMLLLDKETRVIIAD